MISPTLIALLLCSTAAAPSPEPAPQAQAARRTKVALLPFSVGDGVTDKTANALSEPLAGEIRRVPGVQLITQQEITTLLGYDRQRKLLDCRADSCLAELGGALGAERLAYGTVSVLGESWLVSLKLLDTRKSATLAQSDRRFRKGTVDDVLDAFPSMVAEVFGQPAPAPKQVASGPSSSSATTVASAGEPEARPNLLFIELLGSSAGLTLNYERLLLRGESVFDIGLRAGIGLGALGMVELSLGSRNHRFQVGGGVSYPYFAGPYAAWTVGYRYQSSETMMFRFDITPLKALSDRRIGTEGVLSEDTIPMIGCSLGWAI